MRKVGLQLRVAVGVVGLLASRRMSRNVRLRCYRGGELMEPKQRPPHSQSSPVDPVVSRRRGGNVLPVHD
jgi:hypothetical protein